MSDGSYNKDFDTDLPSVAAMAAAEIDNLLRAKPSAFEYLGLLNAKISSLFVNDDSHGTQRNLIDPVATGILARSLHDARGETLRSYEDLVSASKELSRQIESLEEGGANTQSIAADESVLVSLKEVCLQISRYALASREKFEEPFGSSNEYLRVQW